MALGAGRWLGCRGAWLAAIGWLGRLDREGGSGRCGGSAWGQGLVGRASVLLGVARSQSGVQHGWSRQGVFTQVQGVRWLNVTDVWRGFETEKRDIQ